MLRDCKNLVKVQLLRLFGLNELQYTRDKKKRNNGILMGISFLIVGFFLVIYIGLMAYSLAVMGLVDLIPAYILVITSMVILVFSIFKMNGMLFGAKDYEMLTSLPVRTEAVVASRFLTLYAGNLGFACLTMFPSAIVYVMYAKVSFSFFIMLIISVFIIPLIPLTVSAIISVIITAISSRMKHKNLVTIVLSFILCIGVIALSFRSGEMNQQMMSNFSQLLTEQLQKLYPLAPLFTKAVVSNSWLSFLIFAMISIAVFGAFVVLTAWKYNNINSALKARTTKNNYVLKELEIKAPWKALYQKELKRYFSSSIYVLNTGIGYIMAIGMGIAVLVLGIEGLDEMLGVSGGIGAVTAFVPLIIAAIICIGSTTMSSISLEGKQWDMLIALPISAKTLFNSKILVNLTLSIPTTLITSVLIAIALDMTGLTLVLLFLTPIVYSLFSAVFGIFINVKMPNFNWDNEAVVVKQSGATLIGMFVPMAATLAPIIIIVVIGINYANLIIAAITVILGMITFLLYHQIGNVDLKQVG